LAAAGLLYAKNPQLRGLCITDGHLPKKFPFPRDFSEIGLKIAKKISRKMPEIFFVEKA
jgi:hypothetical protein